jgi:hypothetical protein
MTSLPPPTNPNKRPRIRNARTAAKIRRDVIWQIAVPLGVAVLIAIVLGVLVVIGNRATVQRPWADITLIFLSLPTLLVGLIVLAIVVGLVAGLVYALRELPYFFKIVQDFMALFSYRVQAGADKVSGAFLSIRAVTAGAQRVIKDVRRTLRLGG